MNNIIPLVYRLYMHYHTSRLVMFAVDINEKYLNKTEDLQPETNSSAKTSKDFLVILHDAATVASTHRLTLA